MKKREERKEALWRALVLVVSGVILWVWGYLAYLLIIINWLIVLIAGYRKREIAEFIEYWNTEVYRFFRYLSGISNERPFPFSEMQRMGGFEK